MKFMLLVLFLLIILVLLLVLLAALSPWPISLFIRFLFRKSPESCPEDYEKIKNSINISYNISYGSRWSRGYMDIYTLKEQSLSRYPLIIWIHGGAFVASDKKDTIIYSSMLASEGYAVASLNYSLGPDTAYPAALMQIAEAIDSLRSLSDTYRIDMDNIVLAGDSAGANYAAQFLLSQTDSFFNSTLGINKSLAKDDIKGILLYCGPYDVKSVVQRAGENRILGFIVKRLGWGIFGNVKWQENALLSNFSIIDHVQGNFPPVFITDGNTGSFQKQGEEFAAKLKTLCIPVTSLFFDEEEYKTNHEYQFLLDTVPGSICRHETLDFLRIILKSERNNGLTG